MIDDRDAEHGSGAGARAGRLAADGLGRSDQLASGTFDALLRTLVSWDLVVPDERLGRDGWRLSDAAEARLCQLEQRTAWAAEQLVYFDHWCEACRVARPTRLVEGRYLCERCRRPAPAATVQVADAHRRWLLRRRRDTGAPTGPPDQPGEQLVS